MDYFGIHSFALEYIGVRVANRLWGQDYELWHPISLG